MSLILGNAIDKVLLAARCSVCDLCLFTLVSARLVTTCISSPTMPEPSFYKTLFFKLTLLTLHCMLVILMYSQCGTAHSG